MRRSPNDVSVTVSAPACILLALMLLLLPIKWVFAALLAGLIHEFAHAFTIVACGGRIESVNLGGAGAVISTGQLRWGRELICALAGPFAGLAMIFLAKWMPRVAVCAALQSLYNLLPVYPLDGGRALRCGAQIIFPKWADRICAIMESVTLAAVAGLSVYACFWLRLGIMPLLLGAAFWLKIKNTPCKEPQLKLQ